MTASVRRIARFTGILAASTGVSRILGFVRDIYLARLFGTTLQAQAFVVAFRLPNLLRDLVAEGAVTSGVVPVLSWYRAKERPEEFWRLSQALWARSLVWLCVLGAAGTLAAPVIVRLIAPGFATEPEKLALTIRLTQLLFPFVTLVGLWAYFTGLLNSLHHFAMPALGPAILNLAMIIACVWFVPRVSPGVLAVAIAVMIGGVIQLAVQVPVAMRLGFRWGWRWSHPGSDEVLRLLGPRVAGAAVYQINAFVHTALASLGWIVGEGAVAALYFANRLVQLPLALFGTAAAQASLPSMSEQAAHEDWEAFRGTLLSVVRMVGFVMLPASAGLAVLAFPIVGGLFERGAFDRHATIMTSQALIYYALGLLAFSLSKVFTGSFYALRDTQTPVRLAAEAVAVNVGFSLILMWPLQVSGLALSASLANILNTVRLAQRLERRLKTPILKPSMEPLARMAAASLVMGAGCWVAWANGLFRLTPWIGLPMVIVAGLVLYGVACWLLRVPELSSAIRWVSALPVVQRFVSA